MNLLKYQDAYYEFSGKASDAARQLSFAGIALIWIFRNEKAGALAVPADLILPAACFVFALALDLLQYSVGAAIWGLFHRVKEKQGVPPERSLLAPPWLNWPTLFCFWGKLSVVIAAYWLVFSYVLSILRAT